MTDLGSGLDYGERLVRRYRASGMTRKGFAEGAGISVSALDYYVRRERRAALPAGFPPNRILPVDVIAAGAGTPESGAPESGTPGNGPAGRGGIPCGGSAADARPGGIQPLIPSGGVVIRLAGGRVVEVERGFDAELLCEVLAALEARGAGERA